MSHIKAIFRIYYYCVDLQEHIELKLTVLGGVGPYITIWWCLWVSGRCLKVSFGVWIVSECIYGCLDSVWRCPWVNLETQGIQNLIKIHTMYIIWIYRGLCESSDTFQDRSAGGLQELVFFSPHLGTLVYHESRSILNTPGNPRQVAENSNFLYKKMA